MKNKSFIALAILGMTVGFAAISTNLYINGSASIKKSQENFDKNVIFTAASIDQASKDLGVTDPEISADGKSITFTTQTFDEIGDSTTLSYTITNKSTYKAMFGSPAIVCEPLTEAVAYDNYLQVSPGNNLDGKTIIHAESISDTLEISMKKSYVGDLKTITYTCTIDVTALERTEEDSLEY